MSAVLRVTLLQGAQLLAHAVPRFDGTDDERLAEITLMHLACPYGPLCIACMHYVFALDPDGRLRDRK